MIENRNNEETYLYEISKLESISMDLKRENKKL